MRTTGLYNELFCPTMNPFVPATSRMEEYGLLWPGECLLGREVSVSLICVPDLPASVGAMAKNHSTLPPSLTCSVYRKSCKIGSGHRGLRNHHQKQMVGFRKYNSVNMPSSHTDRLVYIIPTDPRLFSIFLTDSAVLTMHIV